MNLQVYKSLQELSQAAVEIFLSEVNGSSISIVVPGGKTPRYFFQFLSQSLVDWQKVTIILSDERMVSVNHKASNYGMIKKMLLEELDIGNKPHIIPEMEKFKANDNEKFLYDTNLLLEEKSPIVHAFLGLGSDGHTASLFSGQEKIFKTPNLCEVTKHPETNQTRITLTPFAIQRSACVTYHVIGKKKAEIVSALVSKSNKNNKYPAANISGEWYLDQAAAANLKK